MSEHEQWLGAACCLLIVGCAIAVVRLRFWKRRSDHWVMEANRHELVATRLKAVCEAAPADDSPEARLDALRRERQQNNDERERNAWFWWVQANAQWLRENAGQPLQSELREGKATLSTVEELTQ